MISFTAPISGSVSVRSLRPEITGSGRRDETCLFELGFEAALFLVGGAQIFDLGNDGGKSRAGGPTLSGTLIMSPAMRLKRCPSLEHGPLEAGDFRADVRVVPDEAAYRGIAGFIGHGDDFTRIVAGQQGRIGSRVSGRTCQRNRATRMLIAVRTRPCMSPFRCPNLFSFLSSSLRVLTSNGLPSLRVSML